MSDWWDSLASAFSGGFTPVAAPRDPEKGYLGATPGGGLGGALYSNRNALVGLGLGLMGGSPGNRFGDALRGYEAGAANDVRAQNVGMTQDIKEYQFAKAQGFQGSFSDWQKYQANNKSQYGLQGVPVWNSQTNTYDMYQLHSQLPPRKVDFQGASPTVPMQKIDTGTGTLLSPSRMAPGIQPYPGQATPSVGGNFIQPTGPGQPTTSATDAEGRPIVPEPAAPTSPPNVIQKNLMGQKEQQQIGTDLAKTYADVQKQAMAGMAQKNTFNRMSQLNDQAYQGAGAPGLQQARSLLATFGVDPGGVPAGEELQALSARLTLDATGGSLGNQISNADRDFIVSQNPSLANTREGRKQLIETGIKIADRKIEVAKMANEYRAKNGNLYGFQEYAAKWADAHPLFPEGQRDKQSDGTKPSSGEGGWKVLPGGVKIRERL